MHIIAVLNYRGTAWELTKFNQILFIIYLWKLLWLRRYHIFLVLLSMIYVSGNYNAWSWSRLIFILGSCKVTRFMKLFWINTFNAKNKINCFETELFCPTLFLFVKLLFRSKSHLVWGNFYAEKYQTLCKIASSDPSDFSYGPFHFGRRGIKVKSKSNHRKVFIDKFLIPTLQITVFIRRNYNKYSKFCCSFTYAAYFISVIWLASVFYPVL